MPQLRPLAALIEPYLDKDNTVPQIAANIGKDPGAVYGCITRMGWFHRVKMTNRVHGRGRISNVFVPDHIHKWLAQQCPAGLRVDEMVTAIVTDAFNEAMEARK